MARSICLWKGSWEKNHIIFYAFVKDISDSQIVAVPHENIYLLCRWSSFLITDSLKAQKNPPGCHIKPANVHCCSPPLPAHRLPHPDPLSSPSGILLFSWWKRLLRSCTNELALLLNDVCKLWPSLLPMNGVETQNPHRQLGACSHCEQLSCGVKLVLDAGWSLVKPFAAHWRCLVVWRQTSSYFFPLPFAVH